MAKFALVCLVTIISFFEAILFFHPSAAYSVVNFGARGDGRTDSTAAFLRTWVAACRSAQPSAVSVPRGVYLLNKITFMGPCRSRILFEMDGTLVAPSGNYYAIANSGSWIMFYKVSRLSLVGGTIDGKGAGFWACRRNGQNCPAGAMSISVMWCNNIVINGLTSLNSQRVHIGIDHSQNVRLQNVHIIAPSGSPNTDGIHVETSMGITVVGSTFRTGDDCISIGPGTMNVWIAFVTCGPGHGISVGSLGNNYNEEGVQNVTVTNSVFTKTQNGIRVKSWARPSIGYAKNLLFRNLIMRNVANPIIIDQKYCPDSACPHQNSGVQVSQVTYRNIKGTSATQAAMSFDCSPSNPCRAITVQDIKLTYVNPLHRPTVAYCSNAMGTHKGIVIPRSCI